MTPLAQIFATQIAATGPITLADYIHTCLLHPAHGYYATRDPLGSAGDFTTAPEISQMFGELLGLSLAQCWLDQGAPAQIALAELGPGRGTLMADILRATAKVPGFADAISVHLVEALGDTQPGDIVELCPALPGIAAELGQRIAAHGGAALIVDYGDWRSLGDTLQAIQAHEKADPFAAPGHADLTAHIDFEALALAASPATCTRVSTQGVFLERLGISPARAVRPLAYMPGSIAALAVQTNTRSSRSIAPAWRRPWMLRPTIWSACTKCIPLTSPPSQPRRKTSPKPTRS